MSTWLHKLVVVVIGVAVAWRCFNPAILTLPDNATYYQKQHFVSGIDLTSTLFQIVGMLFLGAVLLYTLPQQLPSLRTLRKKENSGQGKPQPSQPTQHHEESKRNTPPIEEDKTKPNASLNIIGTFLIVLIGFAYVNFVPDSDKGLVIVTTILLGLGAIIYGHYGGAQITTKDEAFRVIRNAYLCFYIIAIVSIGVGILATLEIIYQREFAVGAYLAGIGLIICGVLLNKSCCPIAVFPSILFASIIVGSRFADYGTSHQGLGLILAFIFIFLPSARAYAATIKLQQLIKPEAL